MAIHIQDLHLQNIGPLDEMQVSLKQVNLFYGLNESGKTYLVEFLLHSIFRQVKNWDLRDSGGKGIVQVTGLGEEPAAFSLESSRKIEGFWEEDGQGLPLNMARLLVVRGGELALSAGSPGGVDRDTLRVALTSQALLDQIANNISATVRKATLVDGQVVGDSRGLIKNRSELREEIHDLESLLEQIDRHYSQGPAREIERSIKAARDTRDAQHKSKRSLAYQTQQRIDSLQAQRESTPEKDLLSLRDSIRDLETLDRDIGALRRKIEQDRKDSKNYRWLETALALWEEKGLDTKKSPSRFLGMAGLGLLGIGAVLLALENFVSIPELIWAGSGMALIGFSLSLYSGIQFLKWGNQIEESRERKTIQDKFEEKFNAPLSGLVDLKAKKASLQEIYLSSQTRKSLLDEKTNQRTLQRQSIENSLLAISGKSVPEKDWPGELADLSDRSDLLNEELLEAKLQLSALNISEEDYYKESTDIEYDPELIQGLEEEIEGLEKGLTALQSDLETLKARACERTGDEVKLPWKEVLYHLQTLLGERIREYKILTAELVAKIGLTEVLHRLREEEDQKIVRAINTEPVPVLLQQITGRYQKLDLHDDQLFVHDALSRYALKDLSTGAREQVLLALRLGIASQICGGVPLFLILDDAFQHSDWQRREALVKSTLDLAQNGWQIHYLSMDEHIRDLFLKIVKPVLKKDFKLIELG